MSCISSWVMARLGSDARARVALKRLIGKGDQTATPGKTIGWFFFFLRFLAACLGLPLLWASSLIVLMPFFALAILKGHRISEHVSGEQWEALFDLWGETPFCSLTKVIEIIYLGSERVERPAMEIGTYNGAHSSCVFAGEKLDLGMEYVADRLIGFAESGQELFENLMSADVFDLPVADGCMRTIYVIHSFDDFEHDVRSAVMHIARSLMPDGRLVFTSFSDHFKTAGPFTRLMDRLGLKGAASWFFSLYYLGVNPGNLLSRKEWEEMLEDVGMEVERYHEFVPASYLLFFDVPARLESVSLNLLGIKRPFFPFSYLLPGLYKDFVDRVVGAVYLMSHKEDGVEKEGVDVFVVARKRGAPGDEAARGGEFDLASSLICPWCRKGVQVSSKINDGRKTITGVACSNCDTSFPVVRGVPLLFAGIAGSEAEF